MPLGLRRVPAATLLIALAALSAPPLRAQGGPKVLPSRTTYTGQAGVFVPPRTDAGSWDGTWYYASTEAKIALWMRSKRGRVEARVKYQDLKRPQSFETDWKGASAYYNAEQPSRFDLKLTRTTVTDVDGTWKWDTRNENVTRSESGVFSLYRALDGRTLVMEFKEYEMLVVGKEKTIRLTQPPTWTFIKASKREALWDELPF